MMTKLQRLEKSRSKILIIISISLLTFIIMVIGFNINTVFAEQTDTINKTRIVSAPINKVWNIISDVDKNSNYWPITGIKNINKTGNTIEREVLTPPNNNKAHQFITLNPEKSVIENQTEGAITGIKTITLSPVDSNANKTYINVLWNLDLSKIPIFGKGFAKDNIGKSVDEAVNKIEKALQ
jgi:carbon monoxide dehydrogenase subunit G